MPKQDMPRKRAHLAKIGFGENPKGFTAQTPNGTAKAGRGSSGWNKQFDWERPQVDAVGPWKGNRTGE
jgi:hypothetical protein